MDKQLDDPLPSYASVIAQQPFAAGGAGGGGGGLSRGDQPSESSTDEAALNTGTTGTSPVDDLQPADVESDPALSWWSRNVCRCEVVWFGDRMLFEVSSVPTMPQG
eukprot:m.174120 g.174120  ORF g.174120 m.174120 type:complete len:106 (+) comp17885_c1_seq5:177-494(+)